MPELPEVEYTARQLRASVIGATMSDAQVFWERTIGYPDIAQFLTQIKGRRIEGVRRRGKFLLVDLSGEYFLSIHRRMSGNFLLLPMGWQIDTSTRENDPARWSVKGPIFYNEQAELPVSADSGKVSVMAPIAPATISLSATTHCRVCFSLHDGRTLLFTDPRKFGRIELWAKSQEDEAFAFMGPEPLGPLFTPISLTEALTRRKTPIKTTLLDQEVVAGLGNIYADEALFDAQIHPLRPANTLNHDEIQRLHASIIAVLQLGIEHGGTSFNDYRDIWGEEGSNFDHMRVYQRTNRPCLTCATPIERITVAQRSTHYCPICQPTHQKQFIQV